MRVGILTKRRDACYHIRCLVPQPHLQDLGYEINEELLELQSACPRCRDGKIHEYQFLDCGDFKCQRCSFDFRQPTGEWKKKVMNVIEWADLIVFQRPTDLSHLKLMKKAKELGKKTIFEGDDDYINVPEWNPGYAYYKQRLGIVEEMLRIVDGVTVTTEPLKELYSGYNRNVFVLPNSIDIEILDCELKMPMVSAFNRSRRKITLEELKERRNGKTFIGWGGSPTHWKDLEIVVPALRRIARKEKVIFGFVGYAHQKIVELIPEDQLIMFNLVPVSAYFSLYKTLAFDIGIAPVVDVKFNHGKSANKLIEYHALGSLGVASDSVTYSKDIHRGFLAHPNEDYGWVSALRKAINCEDRKDRLAANRKYAEEKYDIKNTIFHWDKAYQQVFQS